MAKKQTTVDAATLLKEIEANEAEALKAFQEQQKAKREKALADVLEPLRTRRAEIDEKIKALEDEGEEIDRQIAKLSGKPMKAPKAPGGSGKRHRMSLSDKAAFEATALTFIGKEKDGASRKQVAEHLGLENGPTGTILKALKEAGKVKTVGEKAASRYFGK